MKTTLKIILLATLLVLGPIYVCFSADTLLGLWQSGTSHDNSSEYYTTIEFLTNGVCHKNEVIKNSAGKIVAAPLNGTYKTIDTNHIEIELIYNPTLSTKMKFNLGYAVSNDVLYLQSFDWTGSINKYQRAKTVN